MTSILHDPVELAIAMIREPSVTGGSDTAQDVLAQALETLGFRVSRHPFDGVDNLYARLGSASPNFCFAGHTDVVPPGDVGAWTSDPFKPEIRNGRLYGRGAADMKCAIAAFVSACARMLQGEGQPRGSISLLITGDEEGPSVHGTRRLLPAIYEAGERIDHCLVGEPTSENAVGDVIKNGRRGSLNGVICVHGLQGHVAYPEKAGNPVPVLLDLLAGLRAASLDQGSEGFQPSNLEITSIDVGNPAHNVIPPLASARFNIRFNPRHSGNSLTEQIRTILARKQSDMRVTCDISVSGEAFYTAPGRLTDILAGAVKAETGQQSMLSTSGGTSDARFIKDFCPVAELGLRNETAHKVDEHVGVDEIETLCRIYQRVLEAYFRSA
jgi:succinyl-diaminopimelate desuccinylase